MLNICDQELNSTHRIKLALPIPNDARRAYDQACRVERVGFLLAYGLISHTNRLDPSVLVDAVPFLVHDCGQETDHLQERNDFGFASTLVLQD